MGETFGEKWCLIEKKYNDGEEPLTIAVMSAVLVEELLHNLFDQFHLSLETDEERWKLISLEEKRVSDKQPAINSEAVRELGHGINAYRALCKCKAFSSHPWLNHALLSEMNLVNRIRIDAVHAQKGRSKKIQREDASKTLLAAKVVIEKTGFENKQVGVGGIGGEVKKQYADVMALYSKAEESKETADYKAVISMAKDLLNTMLGSLLLWRYPFLEIEKKKFLLNSGIFSASESDERFTLSAYQRFFQKVGLSKQIKEISELNQAILHISKLAADDYTKLNASFYIAPVKVAYKILEQAGERHEPKWTKSAFFWIKFHPVQAFFIFSLCICIVALSFTFLLYKIKQHTIETWTEPLTGMRFVRLPGGCFEMGCAAETAGCNDDSPSHETCLEPFWIGQYEVTQAGWLKIMAENPSGIQCEEGKECTVPVNWVDMHQVGQFIETLNQKIGGSDEKATYHFQLPTEAQWEYACRSAGTAAMHPGEGGADIGDYAWFQNNSESEPKPVGQKQPNEYAVFDMLGNVAEWCIDRYDPDAYDYPVPGDLPKSLSGNFQVIRGGGFDADIQHLRCTLRGSQNPAHKDLSIGFRLVRVSK